MMPAVLATVALILALVRELETQGRDLTAWAVVCLALAMLWGRLA